MSLRSFEESTALGSLNIHSLKFAFNAPPIAAPTSFFKPVGILSIASIMLSIFKSAVKLVPKVSLVVSKTSSVDILAKSFMVLSIALQAFVLSQSLPILINCPMPVICSCSISLMHFIPAPRVRKYVVAPLAKLPNGTQFNMV